MTQLGIVENKPGQKMDLVFLDRSVGLTCADPTVRLPTAQTYLRGAAQTDGYTIQRAEAVKNAKYKQKVEAAGHRFRPLVVETEGRWSEETARFLRDLAKPIADVAENNSTFIRNRLVDKAWKELGCTLHKFNGHLILSRTVAANNYRLPADTHTYTSPNPAGGLQELFTPEWV